MMILTLAIGNGAIVHAQSSSATALALQVLELSGMPEVLRISDSAYVAALLRNGPHLRPYRDVLEEWSGHVYDWGVVGPALARRLASDFTVAELGQVKAFYQTPVGRKILVLRPALQRYMAELTFTAAEQYLPELRAKLRARAAALNRPEPRLN
jgi:hypothetical protein